MFFFGDDRRGNNPIVMIVGIIIVILAPIMALIIQMAVSRQREYLADATSAMTTRDGEALASALEKLEQYGRPMQKQNTATAHLYISNPLKPGAFASLFSTHPPIKDRVARLRGNVSKF
jgi:heat shock protein HtpX